MAAIAARAPAQAAKPRWTSPAALDRLLLAGADPDASPALRRRARTLNQRRRRERLARGLERAVAASRTAHPSFSAAIPVHSAEVKATRTLILALASLIRTADEWRPAGLILARRLLTDGNGPLFRPVGPGALRDDVAEAILALGDVRSHSS